MLLVDALHLASDVLPQHARERHRLRSDDVHLQPALAEGGRRLQPDEARAHHHRAAGLRRPFDDGPAVRERPQRADVRAIGSGHGEAPWLRPGGEDERAVGEPAPAGESDGMAGRVQGGDGIALDERDPLL